jgi:surfeit locus 1 family protein
MIPRFPLVPTLVVGLAVAAMIGLGIWQLDRRAQKQAFIAQLATNFDKPAISFPRYPVGDEHLFRRATAYCLEAVAWKHEGAGKRGFRLIATCRTGAEGPGLTVDMGTTRDPKFAPKWKGGEVTGTITHAPDHRSLLAGLFDRTPKTLMLVSETAAPGLEPDEKPDLGSVPNNHLAYAVQWFLFAAVASVIYLLALRYRQRGLGPPKP